jgi:hypothetical protein
MGFPVLDASTPTLAPERPVSPEVKVLVLLRERDLEEVEPGGLLEGRKMDVRRMTATSNKGRP